MNILSLSKGDPQAKQLLGRAIRARYGVRPIGFESLRLHLAASRAVLWGLLRQQITATVTVQTNGRWRWEVETSILGFNRQRHSMGYDGAAVYIKPSKPIQRDEDPRRRDEVHCRAWALLCFALTPLTAEGVTLQSTDTTTFLAHQDSAETIKATVTLQEGDSVRVEVQLPDGGGVTTLEGSGELKVVDGLSIPAQLIYRWHDAPPLTYTVTSVTLNPSLDPGYFALMLD